MVGRGGVLKVLLDSCRETVWREWVRDQQTYPQVRMVNGHQAMSTETFVFSWEGAGRKGTRVQDQRRQEREHGCPWP